MTFIHPLASVTNANIGSGTNIWQFVVIMEGANIGSDCNICAQVLIEGDVVIGDRVTTKSGVQIWNGTTIQDNVFIGPNATFSNDLFPRSKDHQSKILNLKIKRGASIGANVTLLPGLTIGEGAMVGAGSVVIEDIPAGAVVVGNPGKVIRYLDN